MRISVRLFAMMAEQAGAGADSGGTAGRKPRGVGAGGIGKTI